MTTVDDFIQEMESMIADFDKKLESQVPKDSRMSHEVNKHDYEEDENFNKEIDLYLRDAYNKLIKDHLLLLDEYENLEIQLKEEKNKSFENSSKSPKKYFKISNFSLFNI